MVTKTEPRITLSLKFQKVKLILVLGLASFFYLCLLSFHPDDASSLTITYPQREPVNLGGIFGVQLAAYSYFLMGLSSYFTLLPAFHWLYLQFKSPATGFPLPITGWILALICISGLGNSLFETWIIGDTPMPAFGILGKHLSSLVALGFGLQGQYIFYTTFLFVALTLIIDNKLVASSAYFMRKKLICDTLDILPTKTEDTEKKKFPISTRFLS